jgi:tRNA G18 (ribose-2'-O)-methylase SpoU
MARIVSIEDPADERVADYVGLTDAALRRRIEEPPGGPGGWVGQVGQGGSGIFVAEGLHVIRRLLRSDYRLRSVLVIPRRLEALAGDLADVDAPVYVAGPDVMNAVAGFDVHRGALAAADRRPLPDPGPLLAGTARVGVLEGIGDHENLGAIFRNAAALGVGALLLSPGCCDPLYRRAVRVSMGHVLDVPYATLEPWPAGLKQVADAGFRLVALTPASEAVPIDELGLRSLDRVALLLGAEDRGLTAAATALAHVKARIPMRPGVDSLNVASAAAIAFHCAAAGAG